MEDGLLSRLHDATLVACRVHWSDGTVSFDLRLWNSPQLALVGYGAGVLDQRDGRALRRRLRILLRGQVDECCGDLGVLPLDHVIATKLLGTDAGGKLR